MNTNVRFLCLCSRDWLNFRLYVVREILWWIHWDLEQSHFGNTNSPGTRNVRIRFEYKFRRRCWDGHAYVDLITQSRVLVTNYHLHNRSLETSMPLLDHTVREVVRHSANTPTADQLKKRGKKLYFELIILIYSYLGCFKICHLVVVKRTCHLWLRCLWEVPLLINAKINDCYTGPITIWLP